MRVSLICTMLPLTALVIGAGTPNATALPLTVFRYEAQAQRHCPDDTVVWLDFRKEIYYFKHQKITTPTAVREASCVGRKLAAAAIVARCLDFGRSDQVARGSIKRRNRDASGSRARRLVPRA